MVLRVNFENLMVLQVNFENLWSFESILKILWSFESTLKILWSFESTMKILWSFESTLKILWSLVNCTWYFVIIIYKKYFPQVNDEVTFPVRDIKSVEGNSAKTNIVRSIGSGLLKRQRTRRWPTRIVGKT